MRKTSWIITQLHIDRVDLFYSYFQKNIYNQFPEFTSKTRTFFIEEYPLDKLQAFIKEGTKIIFIAEDKNNFIGFLMANKAHGGVSFCEWLVVDKKYHQKGVGTALLKSYEVYFKKKGAHKIHLWCADKNVAFYQKNRYILAGRIAADYFGTDNNLLYKTLQKPKESNFLKK